PCLFRPQFKNTYAKQVSDCQPDRTAGSGRSKKRVAQRDPVRRRMQVQGQTLAGGANGVPDPSVRSTGLHPPPPERVHRQDGGEVARRPPGSPLQVKNPPGSAAALIGMFWSGIPLVAKSQ